MKKSIIISFLMVSFSLKADIGSFALGAATLYMLKTSAGQRCIQLGLKNLGYVKADQKEAISKNISWYSSYWKLFKDNMSNGRNLVLPKAHGIKERLSALYSAWFVRLNNQTANNGFDQQSTDQTKGFQGQTFYESKTTKKTFYDFGCSVDDRKTGSTFNRPAQAYDNKSCAYQAIYYEHYQTINQQNIIVKESTMDDFLKGFCLGVIVMGVIDKVCQKDTCVDSNKKADNRSKTDL